MAAGKETGAILLAPKVKATSEPGEPEPVDSGPHRNGRVLRNWNDRNRRSRLRNGAP